MIEVKGTRTATKTNDPAAKYILKDDITKSRMPHAIGIFLTGAAIYLKTMLGKKEPEGFAGEDAPAALPQEDEQPLKKGGSLVPLEFPEREMAFSDDDDTQESAKPEQEAFRFSASNVVSLFAAPETPEPVFGNIDQDYFPDPDAWPEPPAPGPVAGDEGDEDDAPVADDEEDEDESDDDSDLERNRAPGATRPVYLFDVVGCAAILIAFSDLLEHASDPDGDALVVSDVRVSAGTVEVVEGGILYHPADDALGPVQMTYKISDGEFAFEQTAHFEVLPEEIVGTDGADALLGSVCADEILGLAGDDNIDGREGNDIIYGGDGDDHIVGGAGDDTIYGGAGDDIIFGMEGDDTISGGTGNDTVSGGLGDDIIFAGEGDDHATGGEGRDIIFGGDGEDTLLGDAGDDVIDGGSGADMIDGGSGSDVLMDGAGRDVVMAGSGDDVVLAAADADGDSYDGGEDFDVLDYAAATKALEIDLAAGTVRSEGAEEDSFVGFEAVSGGQGDDLFKMDAAVRTVSGGGGNNTFEFCDDDDDDGPGDQSHGFGEFRILDFHPGDKVKKEKYVIFEKSDDDDGDLYSSMNGSDADDIPQLARVRFRHERDEDRDEEKTVVEFDWDRDGEMTVYLDGRHELIVVEL